jgi:serine/threonine-protein kinase
VHPNIAQLHDGGVADDGTPYFVLEYVDGRPLDEYCDAGHLTIEERIRLFLSACRAVEYAHQNLIVHRDVKPGNMLVTPRGELKLLDFGIARFVSETGEGQPSELTSAARPVTPGFASPEQIRGDTVTTASDVYSLGVVLHRLVVGVSPFDGSEAPGDSFHAPVNPVARYRASRYAAARIAADRGTTPTALARLLSSDLGAMLTKAIDALPSRRYATAGELATDLERWLAHEPVVARAPSAFYRARKFVRRNRLAVAASVLVAGALATAAITATVQARRIAAERDRAQLAAAQATAFEQVVQSANPMADGRRDATVSEALTWAVTQLDAARYPPPVDAAVRNAIGVTFFNQGRYDEAAPLIRSAYETRRRLYPFLHADLAESLHWMGQIHAYRFGFETDSGRQYLERGLQMRLATLGPDELPLAESFMAVADVLREDSTGAPERVVHPTRGPLDASQLLETALVIYRKANPRGANVATVLNRLGGLALGRGDSGRAERYHLEALALRESLYTRPHPLLGESLYNVAQLRAGRGEFAAAESLYRRSLSIAQATLGTHERVGSVQLALAITLDSLHRTDEARANYVDAVATYTKALGPDDAWTAIALGYLGAFELDHGQPEGAIDHLQRAMAINEAQHGAASWYAAASRGLTGYALAKTGHRAEGIAMLRRSVDDLVKSLGPDHNRVRVMRDRLAEIDRSSLDLNRGRANRPRGNDTRR